MTQYSTPEEVTALGETNPEFREFLRQTPLSEPAFEDVPKMRKDMEAMKAAATHSEDYQYAAETLAFETQDGHRSEFLLFRGKDFRTPSPLIVLIYGGGFITGAKSDMAPLAKKLVETYNATVYCPEYRLAPEHKFPTAPRDIWDFLQWLGQNYQASGADPKAGFIVGGVSAGGNLAAVAARKLLASNFALALTGVFLGIPILYNRRTVPEKYRELWLSREQNRNAHILNAVAIKLIEGYYAPEYESPEFGPFLSSGGKAHPKTYLQICGQDPLRDDGLIYEKVLREQGTPTKMDIYAGLPHGFSGVLPMLQTSRQANADLIDGFSWLLA